MRKALTSIVLLFLTLCLASGQECRSRIRGIVVEESSQEPVVQAVIEVLNAKDSTRLDATVSDLDGRFSIIVRPGNYILKFSMLGLEEQTRTLTISQSQQDNNIGVIRMETATMIIDAAKTIAKVPPVTIIEDTVVYNAAAYKVDDDASITELLVKIPGLSIDGDVVTLHGKQVNRLTINGKQVFGDDIIAGLKNMPAQMIEKIKAYERETDEARISGVDDGEELTVIDLTVKKNFLDGWNSNASVGYGSSGRYSGRYSTNKLTDESQLAAVANIGNENESGLSSVTNRNRLGSGNAGESTEGSAGLTFSKDKDDVENNGNFRYTYTDRDALGALRSESILKTSTSFSSSQSEELARSHKLNANYNLQFKPDQKTTILIKPSLNFTKANTNRFNAGTTYSDIEMVSAVNSTDNKSSTGSDKFNIKLITQYSRKLKKQGRNFTINVNLNCTNDNNNQYQDYNTYYYKSGKTTVRETDNTIDVRSLNGNCWMTYSEPFNKFWSLQTTVSAYSKHETRERTSSDYNDSSLNEHSQGEYNYFGVKLTEGIRYSRKKIYSIFGAAVMKQWGELTCRGEYFNTEALNASPFVRFNYNKSKTRKLKFLYNSYPISPTLYNLLPDANRTNPLHIFCGNPDLKPAYVQNSTFSYNSSNITKQSSLICSAQFQSTSNAVSNSTVYDETTGGRTVTPQNINGNWKASGSAVWNKTLKDSRYSLTNHSWVEYNNNMAYLYDNKAKVDEVNRSTRLMLRDKAEACWRDSWLEVVLSATVEYTDERSLLRPSMDQRPYFFSFGAAPAATMPWKMRLSTNFDVLCQRGYDYAALNKNYLLWNATLSQTFFNGRMTARLSAYDLLNQQCNMVRNFTAERRNTTTFNGVHRYVILRLLWRFGA